MPTLQEQAGPLYERLWPLERREAERFWTEFSRQYADGLRPRARKSLLQAAHIAINEGLKRLTNLYYAPVFFVFAAGIALGSESRWFYLLSVATLPAVVVAAVRLVLLTRWVAAYFRPRIHAEAVAARDTDTGTAQDLSGHRWA